MSLAKEALLEIDDSVERKHRLAAVLDENSIDKFRGRPYDEYIAHVFTKLIEAM
jgi:hypothetical protein